jgi:hypothetical protein
MTVLRSKMLKWAGATAIPIAATRPTTIGYLHSDDERHLNWIKEFHASKLEQARAIGQASPDTDN